MDSFDGSRRRESRFPVAPAERRSPRDPEPRFSRDPEARSLREPEPRSLREPDAFEQRLDRWVNTGRQLVEGVSGGRPGSRPNSRRPEGRAGSRGGFDGLGRWVEDRLDWLLDDSDDWPEPWQESERDGREPPQALRQQPPTQPAARSPQPAARNRGSTRRPLEAISRRGGAAPATKTQNIPPAPPDPQDWPDDDAFSVPRWQRPSAPLRRPDPLQQELEQRRRDPAGDATSQASSPARPLPRSSRRR